MAKSLLDIIDFELIFLSKNELVVVDLIYFKQIETAHIVIEPVCRLTHAIIRWVAVYRISLEKFVIELWFRSCESNVWILYQNCEVLRVIFPGLSFYHSGEFFLQVVSSNRLFRIWNVVNKIYLWK